MRFMKKEYKATSQIRYAFSKHRAMLKLAECYVEQDKHDRAVKAFIDAEILSGKAWDVVYSLYPFLDNEKISFTTTRNGMVIKVLK